jgi:hypothetical protein
MKVLAGILVALTLVSRAAADNALPDCNPFPKILKVADPGYPPNVESRGMPNPAWVIVHFTVMPDGTARDAAPAEINAGRYERHFSELAVKAVLATRFAKVAAACRGRMRIVFKTVG